MKELEKFYCTTIYKIPLHLRLRMVFYPELEVKSVSILADFIPTEKIKFISWWDIIREKYYLQKNKKKENQDHLHAINELKSILTPKE